MAAAPPPQAPTPASTPTTTTAAASTAPDAPTYLAATPTSTNEVTLTWFSTVNDFRYDYRDATNNEVSYSGQVPGTGTSVTVSSLSPGHQYEFRVFAVDGGEESEAAKVTQATKPDPPTGVTVTGTTTTTTITLTWDSSSVNGELKYSYVDHSDNDKESGMIDVASGVTSVTVTVLAGHRYTFSLYTVRYDVTSDAASGVEATAVPEQPTILTANSSSTFIVFSWSPGANSMQDKYVYQIRDVSVGTGFGAEEEVTGTSVTVENLSAVHEYQFSLLAVSGTTRSSAATKTQATFWSQSEVKRLMEQAEEYLLQRAARYPRADSVVQLNYVTRDQSPEYYQNILKNNNGLMTPKLKDHYGSPQNPINGKRYGLFFGTRFNWDTGEPYPTSPYGEARLQLPVGDLLTPDKNLYFADFYCMKTTEDRKHNVILVLCEPGSDDDQFCHDALPLLDINNNPFLCVRNPPPKLHVKVTKNAYVEIFYTNQMNIRQYPREYWKDIKQYGSGREPNPLKNPICDSCNLRPQPQNPLS